MQIKENPLVAGFQDIYFTLKSKVNPRRVKYTKIDKLKLKNINIIYLDTLNAIFSIKNCI